MRRVVKFVELVHQQYEGTQSHNFPQYFLQNGAIYLVSTKRAAYCQTFLYPNCVPFQMDYSSSIDIDTSDDFNLARMLLFERLRERANNRKE